MFDIDLSKEFIVIWVPGTEGHEVDPDFAKASKAVLGTNHQLVLLEYEASWDIKKSVPDGKRRLKKLLSYTNTHKGPNQKIILAGVSQGAWVIGDTLLVSTYLNIIFKAILFGHPSLAKSHTHSEEGYENHSKVLEINNENDAVTTSLDGHESKVAKGLQAIYSKKLSSIPFILWMMVRYPRIVTIILWTVFIHVFKRKLGYLSPHNYAEQMPLAIYWASH